MSILKNIKNYFLVGLSVIVAFMAFIIKELIGQKKELETKTDDLKEKEKEAVKYAEEQKKYEEDVQNVVGGNLDNSVDLLRKLSEAGKERNRN